MNATQALNIQLTALVAVHGIQRVQKALAHIEDGRVAQLDELGTPKNERATRARGVTKTKRKKSVDEIIRDADIDPSIRPLVRQIANAYERRAFLPDLWRVRKFLESEGVEAGKLRSRDAALRKVIDVLGRQPHSRLQDLLAESNTNRGPLAILTDQILGRPAGPANPGPTDATGASPPGH